jgi:hypothetical protein
MIFQLRIFFNNYNNEFSNKFRSICLKKKLFFFLVNFVTPKLPMTLTTVSLVAFSSTGVGAPPRAHVQLALTPWSLRALEPAF